MKKFLQKFSTLLLLFFLVWPFQDGRAASPTTTAKDLSFVAVDGTSFSLSFTKGNGDNRIIVIRKDEAVSFVPQNGATYTASDNITTGSPVKVGEYVVFNGATTNITVYGLLPNTSYHVAIFEYNGTGNATEYLATPLRGSKSTATPPATGATSLSATALTGHSARLKIGVGSGSHRLVLMRKGGPVNATPANLTYYGLNTVLGTDNTVVYSGAGDIFDVFNLFASTPYHFAVFEYNGTGRPVYQVIPPTKTIITTNERPTIACSQFTANNPDGDRLNLHYKVGNGKGRIIIARQGQAVTAQPVDGTSYTADQTFGSKNSSHLGDGQYVVYNGSGMNESGFSNMTLLSLPRHTTYHFAIFDYDLNASNKPVYLTNSVARVSGTTMNEPLTQASGLVIQNVTDKEASLTYTAGSGQGRIIIGRRGAPVDASPEDLKTYNANGNFGVGSAINGDHYVLSAEGQTSTNVLRLQSSTEYHFAVFEYNGFLGKLYLDENPARGKLVTAVRPSIAAAGMSYSAIDGNSLKLTWHNGNGKGRVIVARKASAVTATSGVSGNLKDDSLYKADCAFGKGDEIKPGEFVVYNDSIGTVGTSNSVTVTNFEPNTEYHFAVYEYGQLNGSLQFATASPAIPTTYLKGASFTARPPTTASKSGMFTNVTNRLMRFSWIPGANDMRILVVKAGSPVDATPVNLTDYNASDVFGSGSKIGDGNYVVYKGNGAFVTLTGLQPGVTYHFAVFEANGSKAPVFQNTAVTPAYTESKATLEKPTVAPSNITFSNETSTSFTINFTKGNGGKRLVIMKNGGNVSTRPVDGMVYQPNNVFGAGSDVSSDGSKEYVVYTGDGTSVTVTGLQPAGFYHVFVFEFEEPTTIGTAYLTTFASNSKQIMAAPLTQATTLQVEQIAVGSVKLQWTNGSGQKRILLAREGSEVNAAPTNNSTYNFSPSFGLSQQIGTGNYIVFNNVDNTVTVTNLKPGKNYHFALFEYNQFNSTTYYLTVNPAKATLQVAIPLPVSWISFNGAANDGVVELEWKTAAEVSNKWFEVERSTDGSVFQKIGVVNAGNTAGTYRFIDQQPISGVLYYRLKQVDKDGAFTYSKVVQVKAEEGTAVRLLQNPVGSELKLSVSNTFIGGSYTILDAGGRVITGGNVSSSLPTVGIGRMPSGVYYVKLVGKTAERSVTLRFIHQ